MKSYLIIIILFLTSTAINAQDYRNAIQLSYDYYWGIQYKHMLTQEKGIMGSFQLNNKGAQATAIKLSYTPAFPSTSSQWFFGYGYGMHLAYRTEIQSTNIFRPFAPPILYTGHYFSPGFDGYLSLEYRFLKYPFTVSADFIPAFEFFGPGFFRMNMNNFSICAAFTF